ncbi:hypothetical protein J1614_000118 [Plenodomus biglobosus]|nr:hypothetical protein J1614_000118 [Plenodomus biglobosus]
MSNRFHFKNEMPTSISTEEDLVDDSMDVIPMTGLCTPQSLKSRFIKRLERLLYLKLRIEEDTIQHSITITFTGDKEAKKGRLDAEENVRSFLKAIEDLLNRIAKGMSQITLPRSC